MEIYVKTTKSLNKRGILKLGEAGDSFCRNMGNYAEEFYDLCPAFQVPESYIQNSIKKKGYDKDFHKWLKKTKNITPCYVKEYPHAKELYQMSAIDAQRYIKEFFCRENYEEYSVDNRIKTSCDYAFNAIEDANRYSNDLHKIFNLSLHKNFTFCDIACKDEGLLCACIDFAYKYSNKLSILDIVKHMYAYCFFEDRENIINNIVNHLRGRYNILNNDRKKIVAILSKNIEGIYSIKDEHLKEKLGRLVKRFNVVMQNPPYEGKTKGGQFYVDFINAGINLASDYMISISPDDAYANSNSNKAKVKELHNNINNYHPTLILRGWEGFSANPTSENAVIAVFDKKNKQNKIRVVGRNQQVKEYGSSEELVFTQNEYLLAFYEHLKEFWKTTTYKSFYNVLCNNPKNLGYFCKKGKTNVLTSIEIMKDNKLYMLWMPYVNASHWTTYEVSKFEGEDDKLYNGAARAYLRFSTEAEANNAYEFTNSMFFKMIMLCSRKRLIHCNDRYDFVPFVNFAKSIKDSDMFKLIGMEYDKTLIKECLDYNE